MKKFVTVIAMIVLTTGFSSTLIAKQKHRHGGVLEDTGRVADHTVRGAGRLAGDAVKGTGKVVRDIF